MTTLDALFHHQRIAKVISTIRKPTHKLARAYGLMPGGINSVQIGGRRTAWDIFNSTRKITGLRAPDSPAATTKVQAVGHKSATLARVYEQVPVPMEKIFRKRGLGMDLGSVDIQGERWVAAQIRHQFERFGNMRETLTALMFEGGFEMTIDGDDCEIGPLGSGGQIIVDFDLPGNHKGTVDGVFAGDWENPAAKIIDELINLNSHSSNESRYAMQQAWIDGETAGYILNNQQVAALGGTANTVTADNGQVMFTDRNPDGKVANHMSFVLRGWPSINFNVYDDHVLLSDGTKHQFLKRGEALFTPSTNDGFVEFHEGSEVIKRGITAEREEAYGMQFWVEEVHNPVGFAMFGLDNGLPVPTVPNAWYKPTVHGSP